MVVLATKLERPAMDSDDQSTIGLGVMRGIVDGARSMATFGPAVAVDPGRLGGTLICAPVTDPGVSARACVAVDTASLVAVIEFDSTAAVDTDLPTVVREAVVHRT